MRALPEELRLRLAELGVAEDARLLVAVSGGADSMALLHGLAALERDAVVAHVHHGLRAGEADADLEFVRARENGKRCLAPDIAHPLSDSHSMGTGKRSTKDQAITLRSET